MKLFSLRKVGLLAIITAGLLLLLRVGLGATAAQSAGVTLPPVTAEAPRVGLCAVGCGTDTPLSAQNPAFEEALLAAINQVRAENGLPPLKRHPGLLQSARFHALDMSEDGYFQYDTYDWINNLLTLVCSWNTRISRSYGAYSRLTESIAAGYATPEEVLAAWLAHPGHRANILDAGVREIGLGYSYSATAYYQHYWVLDFGRLDSRYPLLINRDALTTTTATVQLYLYGQGIFNELRLHNDTQAWNAWQPFQSELAWTLPDTPGDHTVWAELRNANSTLLVSDTITLVRAVLAPLPARLRFAYPLDQARFLPAEYVLSLTNSGTADPLTWEVQAWGEHFTVSPTRGTTPAQLHVLPRLPAQPEPGRYTGVFTVSVSAPISSTQRVTVQLDISPTYPPFALYLPMVTRSHPAVIQPRTPNDPLFSQQWALTRIRAPLAWGAAQGEEVLVAVLDTGVDYAHPDLLGKCRTDVDYDFVNDDEDASDDQGHGTHVAGIIAAATDNRRGIAGLGWKTQILALKVMRPTETGQTTGTLGDVTQAVYYATDHGARIINLSLGSDPAQHLHCSAPEYTFLRDAFRYAYEHGVLIFAAAGNAGGDADEVMPVNCPYVIGVGATTSTDTVASFSNRGQAVDISAPGVAILSSVRGGNYEAWDGTSMATPHAAALAALIWSRYPTWSVTQVAAALLDTAQDIGPIGADSAAGCGRIDAAAAVITGTVSSAPQCKSNVFAAPATLTGSYEKPQAIVPGVLLVRLPAERNFQSAPLQAYGVQPDRLLYGGFWRMRVPVGREWDIAQTLLQAGVAELASPEPLFYLPEERP